MSARPARFAACRLQAIQNARRAERIDASLGKCRTGTGPRSGLSVEEPRFVLMCPNFVASRRVETEDDLRLAALFLRKQATANNQHRRPGGADPLPPELLRRMRFPVRRDLQAVNLGSPVGTAKFGPISRLRDEDRRCRFGSRRRPARGRVGAGGTAGEVQILCRRGPAPADGRFLIAIDSIDAEEGHRAAENRKRGQHPDVPHPARSVSRDHESHNGSRNRGRNPEEQQPHPADRFVDDATGDDSDRNQPQPDQKPIPQSRASRREPPGGEGESQHAKRCHAREKTGEDRQVELLYDERDGPKEGHEDHRDPQAVWPVAACDRTGR